MKSATAAMITLLNSSTQFWKADLYTITLLSGAVARYTGADANITANGNVFTAGGIRIERDKVRTVVGIEVDTLDLDIYATSADTIGGVPFLQACRNGALDQATIKLEYAVMPAFGDTSAGTVVQFVGRVADIEVSRMSARLTVKSDLELLNIQMPRNLYQAGCMNTLFDRGCGLTKATFGVTGTVMAGSSLTQVVCSLAQAVDYFSQGTITFASGINANVVRAIRAYAPGLVTLQQPLISSCAAGDTFTIYPGCDKRQATCTSKFSNVLRFRGFPYIPAPETAI